MDHFINGSPWGYKNLNYIRNEWRKNTDALDAPGHLYFKIFFHFLADEPMGNGLLHPSWMTSEGRWMTQTNFSHRAKELDYWRHSSAWSYLKQNGEEERAAYIKKFIEMLSNLSTDSPWYFQSIGGLGDAIQRSITEVKEDERKKLSLSILEDSEDQRIGTLLDLYRMSVWSDTFRREILPTNLRRFDMTVVLFSSGVDGIHYTHNLFSSFNKTGNEEPASYKIFEFHDCEFDYNSISSGLGELSNTEGFTPKYTIDITFNNFSEVRHNAFIEDLGEIKDLVATDNYNWLFDEGTEGSLKYVGNVYADLNRIYKKKKK